MAVIACSVIAPFRTEDTLKMEASHSFEVVTIYQITWHHFPED